MTSRWNWDDEHVFERDPLIFAGLPGASRSVASIEMVFVGSGTSTILVIDGRGLQCRVRDLATEGVGEGPLWVRDGWAFPCKSPKNGLSALVWEACGYGLALAMAGKAPARRYWNAVSSKARSFMFKTDTDIPESTSLC